MADDRCAVCGVVNGAVGARDRHGAWHDEDDIHSLNSDVGFDLFDGEFPEMIRIILVRPHGTERRCQRCFLAEHRAEHAAKAAETRRRRKHEAVARTGQAALELA